MTQLETNTTGLQALLDKVLLLTVMLYKPKTSYQQTDGLTPIRLFKYSQKE